MLLRILRAEGLWLREILLCFTNPIAARTEAGMANKYRVAMLLLRSQSLFRSVENPKTVTRRTKASEPVRDAMRTALDACGAAAATPKSRRKTNEASARE